LNEHAVNQRIVTPKRPYSRVISPDASVTR
jgi:hypothetical protein